MTTDKLERSEPEGPSFAESFRELSLAQKAKKGVPLYCLYVNRPAGRVVAAALRNTRFGPNQVTFAGAFLTYGALLWLAFGAGTGAASALVGVVLAAGFVLDSADGQLARLQGRSSKLGEWLDHVLDGGRIVVLHGAVFCFLLRTTTIPPLKLAALSGVFLFANATIFFAGALFDQLNRQSGPRPFPRPRPANLDKAINPHVASRLRSDVPRPDDGAVDRHLPAQLRGLGALPLPLLRRLSREVFPYPGKDG